MNYLEERLSGLAGAAENGCYPNSEGVIFAADVKLAAISEAVSHFKSQRNSLLPISRLPLDVLARVFHWLSIMEPYSAYNGPDAAPSSADGRESPSRLRKRLGWISATHVCRFWRQTALENPSLWCDITVGLSDGEYILKWPKEILSRSKSTALSVVCRCTWQLDPRNVQPAAASDMLLSIAKSLPRIRTLSLELQEDAVSALQVGKICEQPAPLLEDATFYSTLQSRKSALPTLPAKPFALGAPRLRSLQIKNCEFFWDSLRFPSLTTLDIDLSALDGRIVQATGFAVTTNPNSFNPPVYVPMTADELIESLSALPNLKSLSIRHGFPRTAPSDNAPNFIHLPNLTSLTLAHRYWEPCTWILDRIPIAQLSSLELSVGATLSSGLRTDRTDMLSYIQSYLKGRRVLTLSVATSVGLTLSLWDTVSVHDADVFEPASKPLLKLTWLESGYSSTWVSDAEVQALMGVVPVDETRTLVFRAAERGGRDLEHNRRFGLSSFQALFQRSSAVERVHATSSAALRTLEAIAPSQVSTEPLSHDASTPLPDLTQLSLKMDLFAASLEESIERRMAISPSLRALHLSDNATSPIENPHLLEERVERLKKIVSNVMVTV